MPVGSRANAADNGGTLTVAVRVRPGASRTKVGGSYPGPYGPALVVAVSAPAVDGRATEAVIRAVASALGLRPRAVALRTGQTSRDKLLTVEPDTPQVAGRLRDLLES
ncbi:DUF167 domain-containing protein [Longispora sp. NPDC051575]|uniref:DUF167 domain-containing protein n=1 Tax=Longispora sp. NPDC051575 TaxID=3154943 RepID=UPI003446E3AF